ncbi:hypothetical protein ACIPV2_13160 [Microbacterium sp. NPDC089987]|uniref:hypothetical protein n=1 Tax=Microbacterium sp. NPDC089987 TaxID=3364202 RepID=UPI00380AD8CB
MSHPSVAVAERVRRRLRLENTDPSARPDEARRIAQLEVRRHNDLALQRGEAMIDDEQALVRDVLASVSGFGALQPLLDDPEIEEIWLNGPDGVSLFGNDPCSDSPERRRTLREAIPATPSRRSCPRLSR